MFETLKEAKPLWVLVGVAILLWLWVGGVHTEDAKTGLYTKAPSPLDTGETYDAPLPFRYKEEPKGTLFQGGFQNGIPVFGKLYSFLRGEDIRTPENSVPAANVKFGSRSTGGTSAENEFVTIELSPRAESPLRLTGWKLKSAVTGQEATIGKAVYLPFSNDVNAGQDLDLQPGEKAIVVTGRSPVGYSFRLNQCTGYFEQFQDFSPSLPRECPAVSEEPQPAAPNRLNDQCLDYLQTVPRCSAHLQSFPIGTSGECANFIAEKASYSYCTKTHKNEAGFYKPEWRVFLGRSEVLWKARREVIELIDPAGVIRDSISY